MSLFKRCQQQTEIINISTIMREILDMDFTYFLVVNTNKLVSFNKIQRIENERRIKKRLSKKTRARVRLRSNIYPSRRRDYLEVIRKCSMLEWNVPRIS